MKTRNLLACLLVLLSSAALAAYPERPIKVIMPFPPGGTVDVVSRLVCNEASELLGKPLVLDYMRGKTADYERWLGGMQKLFLKHGDRAK